MNGQLTISTETTGFSSPAENYVSDRLDTNLLLAPNPISTFFFQASGAKYGVSDGDVLVVDRSVSPKEGSLVVVPRNERLELERWSQGNEFWGVVTFSIKRHT